MGLDLNKELRPEIAAFAVAMEFRMRLHDEVYGDSWSIETRRSVFEGMDRNLQDFKTAVVVGDKREMANESCDLANWVRFLPFQDEEVRAEFEKMARAVADPAYEYKHG